MTFFLPGSRRNRSDEPGDPAPESLGSGRFTELEITLLGEIIQWWINRRSAEDSTTPTASFIGGIDLRTTATTINDTTTTISVNGSTRMCPAVAGEGVSYLVHANARTSNNTADLNILALCSYRCVSASSYVTRYTTIARSDEDSLAEIRTATTLGTNIPIMQVLGDAGVTYTWTIELFALET